MTTQSVLRRAYDYFNNLQTKRVLDPQEYDLMCDLARASGLNATSEAYQAYHNAAPQSLDRTAVYDWCLNNTTTGYDVGAASELSNAELLADARSKGYPG